MAIFNSYVSLPKGINHPILEISPWFRTPRAQVSDIDTRREMAAFTYDLLLSSGVNQRFHQTVNS